MHDQIIFTESDGKKQVFVVRWWRTSWTVTPELMRLGFGWYVRFEGCRHLSGSYRIT